MADSTTQKAPPQEETKTTSSKVDLGPQLSLPFDTRSLDGMDWKDFHSPFPNGLSLSAAPKADELERDRDLERAISHGKSYDEIYSPSNPKEEGFGVKVGGVDIPIKSGLTIWDLRDSVLGQPDQHGDLSQRPEPSFVPDYSDRVNTKGARFGLSWTARF